MPTINAYDLDGGDWATVLSGGAIPYSPTIKNETLERPNKMARGDFRKARKIQERVQTPHFTYTPKARKVGTFHLKGFNPGEKPDEVVKMLQEIGTEVKFPSVSGVIMRRSVWGERILLHLRRAKVHSDWHSFT